MAFGPDAEHRHDHHGDAVAPLSGFGGSPQTITGFGDDESTVIFDEDGVTVTAFLVDHRPVDPALGYRFDYGGRSVVISGDTLPSETLMHQAQGVDLLVHEAMNPEMLSVLDRAATASGEDVAATVAHDILTYHTFPEEAARIARDADVGHLVMTHFLPPLPVVSPAPDLPGGLPDIFPDRSPSPTTACSSACLRTRRTSKSSGSSSEPRRLDPPTTRSDSDDTPRTSRPAQVARAPAAVALAASAALVMTVAGPASGVSAQDELACDAEPIVMTTADGVDFVRTPDACFEDLPDWPYEPHYVEIDGLRQAYVDEGPADGEVVLLLHGQPSWSYLYRNMIPVLADAGYRVIAMDHLGMGRSDKPIDIEAYSYLGHNERLQSFIEELELTDINLFVQDWGSLIGLRTAGLDPERYATIAVGDGSPAGHPRRLRALPAGREPRRTSTDLASPFAAIPPSRCPSTTAASRILGPDEATSATGWPTP